MDEALAHLSSPPAGHESIFRVFVIGGAQLYTDLLSLDSSVATVDKLLVTRILAPRYECDAYFPEFRTQEQYRADSERARKIMAERHEEKDAASSQDKPTGLLKQTEWTQASTDTLRQYLGSSCPDALATSSDMLTSEGETWYQYQLWEKAG